MITNYWNINSARFPPLARKSQRRFSLAIDIFKGQRYLCGYQCDYIYVNSFRCAGEQTLIYSKDARLVSLYLLRGFEAVQQISPAKYPESISRIRAEGRYNSIGFPSRIRERNINCSSIVSAKFYRVTTIMLSTSQRTKQ